MQPDLKPRAQLMAPESGADGGWGRRGWSAHYRAGSRLWMQYNPKRREAVQALGWMLEEASQSKGASEEL
ncbi:hypothetical protein MRS44_002487 [Fusarium solani]|uniref:uncharacterized protein n=1 Tax=Fusarium solani TaxID=169388 RepID=UPI0032C4920A|nr:hypothetical protein MRS44_002487 [Fusarium solani]